MTPSAVLAEQTIAVRGSLFGRGGDFSACTRGSPVVKVLASLKDGWGLVRQA